MILVCNIIIIILLLFIIFNIKFNIQINSNNNAEVLEEYQNCTMMTIIHYNQEEEWHIIDISLLEEYGIVGLEVYKKEDPPQGYYETPVSFEGVTLQRIRFINSKNKDGIWVWKLD